MSSNGSDDSAWATTDTQSPKAKRAKGIKLDVTFNRHGQPVGGNASEMQSYIGLLTRQHVNLNDKTWREVPVNVKNLIWESVKSSYNVTEKWKDGCLKSANTKWRTWKTRLYNEFIVPNKDNPTKLYQPPPDESITLVDWSEFVKRRTSPEFQKVSEDQKERRSKNIYPHRLSRRGYASLAEEMKEDLRGDDEVDRAMMWKKARLTKDGETTNEKLQETIQKIDDYIRDKEEGNFVSKGGSEDLLTCALEKSEHSGRVRGIGAYVCPTTYFKIPRETKHVVDEKSLHELECARTKIEEQEIRIQEQDGRIHEQNGRMKEQDGRIHNLDKLVSELVSRIGKLEGKTDKDELSEEKGSCSGKAPHCTKENDDLELIEKSSYLQGKPVALLLGSSKHIVGYGTVVAAGNILHGAPMPKDCFRVSIDEVVAGNSLLPFPISDEIHTVESALATHVAWPTQLVVERSNETTAKKVEKEFIKKKMVKDFALLPPSLRALYRIIEKSTIDGRGLCITLDVDVFGLDVALFILPEDVIPFCDLEPITANCIVGYIWHLYSSMKEKEKNNRFLFMNPFSISHVPKCSRDDRARVLADRLLNAPSNTIVFVPCNVGDHWILTIIEPHKDRVYLMDPLTHRNRDNNWKYVVDTAISISNANKGRRFKKAPHWDIIKGPLQSDSKQCGYYVMRFMKEVVEGFQNDDSVSIASLFQTDRAYSQAEIDEVREEWASCVILHYWIKS